MQPNTLMGYMLISHLLSLKFQEVDEPLQLDMSELCLSDDFIQNKNGKHDIS